MIKKYRQYRQVIEDSLKIREPLNLADKEMDASKIILLLNPQYFGLSFAGIAYDESKRFLLVTFVNKEEIKTFTFDSLEKAKGHFFIVYSEIIRQENIRPQWNKKPFNKEALDEVTALCDRIFGAVKMPFGKGERSKNTDDLTYPNT